MECWNQEFTVTEITNIFKNLAQETFCHIKVRGEISGLSKPKSGHIYFTLKDLESVIYAVCWKTIKLDCSPEDGLEVICSGSITTYQSKYQLSVDQIEICAPGNIAKILLERKAKLELEGIFSQKKTLPFLPKIIGIITSLTGSVINDIINRVKHRFASHLMVWPVSVQGSDAAEDIISAIKGFNKIYINRPDILIIARGGGSVEDLWVFNEEKVVRAVAASKIPIISAIGHENDFTLTDYAADLRAPTPTAAIEMALPTLEELVSKLEFITQKILNHINALIYETENKLSFIDKCISHPKSRIEHEPYGPDFYRISGWADGLNHGDWRRVCDGAGHDLYFGDARESGQRNIDVSNIAHHNAFGIFAYFKQ